MADWARDGQLNQMETRLAGIRSTTLLLVGVVAALLGSPAFDDGFILLRGRGLVDGNSSTLLDPFVRGSSNAQGVVYESVIGLLARAENLVLLRGVPVALVVVAWCLLELTWRAGRLGEVTQRARWLAWVVFVTSMPAFATSLRPESIIAAILTVVLVLIGGDLHHLQRFGFAPLLLAAGLALSIHQSGWTAVVAAGVTIAIAILRGGAAHRLQSLLFAAATAATSLVGLILLLTPLPLAAVSARQHLGFTGSRGVQQGSLIIAPQLELDRYRAVLGAGLDGGSLPHLVVGLLAVLVPVVLLVVPGDREHRGLDVALLSATLGLALTSSKQVTHFLVLVPVAAVAVARLDSRLSARGSDAASHAVAVIFSLSVLHSLGRRGFAGLQVPVWGTPIAAQVAPWVDRGATVLALMAAASAVAAFVVHVHRGRSRIAALASIPAISALLAIGALAVPRAYGVMLTPAPALRMTYVVGILLWLVVVRLSLDAVRSPGLLGIRRMADLVGTGLLVVVLGALVVDAPSAVLLSAAGFATDPGGLSERALIAASDLLRPWALLLIIMVGLHVASSHPVDAESPAAGRSVQPPAPRRARGWTGSAVGGLVALSLVLAGVVWDPLMGRRETGRDAPLGLQLARSALAGRGTCDMLAAFVAAAGGTSTEALAADAADPAVAALYPCIEPPAWRDGLAPLPRRIVTVTPLPFMFDHLAPEQYADPDCRRLEVAAAPWTPEPLVDQVCIFDQKVRVGQPRLELVSRTFTRLNPTGVRRVQDSATVDSR